MKVNIEKKTEKKTNTNRIWRIVRSFSNIIPSSIVN